MPGELAQDGHYTKKVIKAFAKSFREVPFIEILKQAYLVYKAPHDFAPPPLEEFIR